MNDGSEVDETERGRSFSGVVAKGGLLKYLQRCCHSALSRHRSLPLMLRRLCAAVVAVLLAVAPARAQQADTTATVPDFTLETIHATDALSPDSFRGGRWTDEGPVITYVEQSDTSDATHLIRYNLETDTRERLIDGTNLYADDVDRLVEHLKASTKLFMDETTAPVLDPGRGRTKTGYLWALARDDRGWGGADPPGVVFTYIPGRAGANAERLLTGFDGILQVDGYAGYKRLAKADRAGGEPIVLAQCWAHARRKVIDATPKAGSPVAEEALRRIAALYAIEAEIRGRAPDALVFELGLRPGGPPLARYRSGDVGLPAEVGEEEGQVPSPRGRPEEGAARALARSPKPNPGAARGRMEQPIESPV